MKLKFANKIETIQIKHATIQMTVSFSNGKQKRRDITPTMLCTGHFDGKMDRKIYRRVAIATPIYLTHIHTVLDGSAVILMPGWGLGLREGASCVFMGAINKTLFCFFSWKVIFPSSYDFERDLTQFYDKHPYTYVSQGIKK